MYPITNEVKALFESEQKQILRITGGEKSPISKSVGPSAMASFSDAIAADALNLSIDIAPVQSGSGDPSPTNVRPISGWTGANVVVSPTTDAQDGTTYPISWQSEAGTVYGGTLDVTTGLLTVTMAEVDLGTLTWKRDTTTRPIDQATIHAFYAELYTCKKIGFTLSPVMLSPVFKAATVKQVDYGGYDKIMDFLCSGADGNNRVWIYGSIYNDMSATEFKAAMSGIQLVYELATPQTYQLTQAQTQIALLEGVNNVWADCGDVTVEYATGYEYEINITDADVVIDSFNIDRFSCVGNKLEIGTATSAQMTVKLDNYDGRFNGIVFEGTELFVEIGIADWTQSNPTINWIPCGYFTPDEQPRSLNIITIHALDRMMQFDATMPTLTPWVTQSGDVMTDSQGNIIYFVSNVQFPVTVQNLVKRVALLCGVPLTQSLSNLPNYSYTLSALPTLQQEITFRNIIQWCAGIMGANAWIDWTGSLRFSWYGATTGYTSTTSNRFSSDLNEDNITITGVQYTNTQNVTIVSGTADYTIDLTGNYLAAVGISTILPNIRNKVNGFTYRPFTASVINAPYLWPMDIITFTKDGTDYSCAVTNVNFGINGATALESKGETAQTNSGTAPSGVTKEQGFLIEQAADVTRKLDESLDQEGIFNRLTDNGETQGLLLYNGKVYLNASYIQAGTLVADFIKGGTLTMGGSNNINGVIEVLDADGNIKGYWGNNLFSVDSRNLKVSTSGVLQTYGWATAYGYGTTTISAGEINFVNENHSDYPAAVISQSIFGESLGIFLRVGGFGIQENEAPYDTLVSIFNGECIIRPTTTLQNGLTVYGTKSRLVSTDQYSDRLLYCYETPTPMFGDIGEGKIGEDGLCYISLDAVFAQTVVTQQYQVFLQRYGEGECWVRERKGAYFIVQGTPGLAFGWEIKAKQRDYDQRRLERNDEPFTVPTQTYGEDAAKHIDELRKERISA